MAAPSTSDIQAAAPDARAQQLKISRIGELPCDSGEWSTSTLFGPPSRVMAALGYGASSGQATQDPSALADALGEVAPSDPISAVAGAQFASVGSGGGGAFGGGSAGGGAGSGPSGSPGTSGGSDDGTPVTGGSGTGGNGATAGGGTAIDGGTTIGGGTSGGGASTGGGGTTISGGTGATDGGGLPGVTPIPGSGSGATDPGGTGIDGSSPGTNIPTHPGTPGTRGSAAPLDPGAPDGGPIIGNNPPTTIIVAPPVETGSGHGATAGGPTLPQGPIAAVPEPASWMTMMFGYWAIGATMRQRRRALQV